MNKELFFGTLQCILFELVCYFIILIFYFVTMRIFVNFGNVKAFGEDVRLWSFFNGHLLIYRARHRFRWLVEIL